MPLPFILGAVAAIAGVTGVGAGIHGAAKMADANDTIKQANERHERNIARFNLDLQLQIKQKLVKSLKLS